MRVWSVIWNTAQIPYPTRNPCSIPAQIIIYPRRLDYLVRVLDEIFIYQHLSWKIQMTLTRDKNLELSSSFLDNQKKSDKPIEYSALIARYILSKYYALFMIFYNWRTQTEW